MIALLPSAQIYWWHYQGATMARCPIPLHEPAPLRQRATRSKKKKKKIESCRVALWSRGSNSKYVAVILMSI
jgi:hypothetical protein